jgi:nucleotide-binding universal stress UspA family protein
MNAPVVVGVDGSAPSLAAVDAAAREAALRGRPLTVIHAFIWPYVGVPVGLTPLGPIDADRLQLAERVVRAAVHRAGKVAPGVTVTGEAVTGSPAGALVNRSRTAALVVVGHRGIDGFAGLLVGSVASQVATHAAAPVLVVRGRPDPTGEILLAVDGSPHSDPAVGFAFEEAALRGAMLTALHTWTHPKPAAPGDMLPLVYDLPELEAEEARVLTEALAGWHAKYPDVTVRRRLVRARTRPTLIEETSRAQLAVVGTRGHGGFTGMLLGSVSQAALHHADCPVVIVPASSPEEES